MVIVVAFLLVILTHLLLKKTKIGKAMRATFQDLEAASLMGIKIDRIYSFTFVLGVGLAALRGLSWGPSSRFTPTSETWPTPKPSSSSSSEGWGVSRRRSRRVCSWASLRAWARATSPRDIRMPSVSSFSFSF